MNWKKLLYYVPGVGFVAHTIREYKTRKGKNPWYNLKDSKDRKALGIYALEVSYFAFALLWKVYVGNGIATRDWNPFHLVSKDKIERTTEKESNLEKTIMYEEVKKSLEN